MASKNSNNDNQTRRRSSQAHFKQPKKHRGLKWTIFIVLLILITGGAAYGIHAYFVARDTFQATYQKGDTNKLRNVNQVIKDGKPLSILLLGTDTGALGRHDTGRTDTIIVATVNAQKKTAYLTSIPRDTNVTLQGGTQKINAAYTLGGAPMAVDTVQNLLDVPIDFYALVNMGGLEKMVNAVGGVDLKPLLTFSYGHAHVVKGRQTHLNGKQALDYSRMRETDPLGDYGRQKRQRQVIQKLLIKAMGIGSIPRYQSILTSLKGNLKTDLTFDDLIAIRGKYGDATHHIKSQTLQGQDAMIDNLSYQVPTATEIARVSTNIRRSLGLAKSTKLTGNAVQSGNANSATPANATTQTTTGY